MTGAVHWRELVEAFSELLVVSVQQHVGEERIAFAQIANGFGARGVPVEAGKVKQGKSFQVKQLVHGSLGTRLQTVRLIAQHFQVVLIVFKERDDEVRVAGHYGVMYWQQAVLVALNHRVYVSFQQDYAALLVTERGLKY